MRVDSRPFIKLTPRTLSNVCLLSAALLLLQACTSVPVKSPVDPQVRWMERQQLLRKIGQWQLKGRIGVITAGDSGSANLYWQQHADEYSIKIAGPFGKGALFIEGNADNVSMTTGENEYSVASSPEELIWQHTGWVIPVSNLRYWILGLPAKGQSQASLNFDDQGRVARGVADGWTVEYRRYETVNGIDVPDKVWMQNDTLQVRVVISDWELIPK